MKKFHKLVQVAKELTRLKESRYILVFEWLEPISNNEVNNK